MARKTYAGNHDSNAAGVTRLKVGEKYYAYPHPTSGAMTRVMRGNRRRDTKPELAIRRLLHSSGLRYRVDLRVEAGGIKVRGDIVFPRQKVIVLVNGCFWHGCPVHGNTPTRNGLYWSAKLAGNKKRDRRVRRSLSQHGWEVVSAWEHEDPISVASRISSTVSGRPPTGRA
jgi:DNA mismatch endonuclease, patch repair protein